MVVRGVSDILLNPVKVSFDKQLEQKYTRESQAVVTLIVNHFSLPLIFHGLVCLAVFRLRVLIGGIC